MHDEEIDDFIDDELFDDGPTQEELDDATIEDTVHCVRCQSSWDITDTHSIDGRSVCPDCVQDGIDEVLAERDRLREESRRFYHADGTFEVLATPEEVIERRKAAAREIERLTKELAAAKVDAEIHEDIARDLDERFSDIVRQAPLEKETWLVAERDKARNAAHAAEQEAATLRVRLAEAERERDAVISLCYREVNTGSIDEERYFRIVLDTVYRQEKNYDTDEEAYAAVRRFAGLKERPGLDRLKPLAATPQPPTDVTEGSDA